MKTRTLITVAVLTGLMTVASVEAIQRVERGYSIDPVEVDSTKQWSLQLGLRASLDPINLDTIGASITRNYKGGHALRFGYMQAGPVGKEGPGESSALAIHVTYLRSTHVAYGSRAYLGLGPLVQYTKTMGETVWTNYAAGQKVDPEESAAWTFGVEVVAGFEKTILKGLSLQVEVVPYAYAKSMSSPQAPPHPDLPSPLGISDMQQRLQNSGGSAFSLKSARVALSVSF